MTPDEGFQETEDNGTTRISETISDILQSMCEDENNTICVISRNGKDKMKAQFGHIQNLYIAAESGFYYGWNRLKEPLEFNKLITIRDWGWKDITYDIIKSYQERTDGSYIVNEETRIRWVFRDVDADFAAKEANELVAHLHSLLEHLPLEIVHEKDYVEVKPAGLDKGTFAKQLLQMVERNKGAIDFILCIGDNETDECTFERIKEYSKERHIQKTEFCITIGQKVSLADYYLNDQSEITRILPEILLTAIEVKVCDSLIERRKEVIGNGNEVE